jgi:hypothetical protein
MRRLLIPSLAACCALVLSSSVALAGDNWLGTWKMNPAKSKYSPGPMPKSLTLKYEQTADGIRHSFHGVDADGKAMDGAYVSKFDGADVPYTGNPDANTSSPKKIDDNSFESTWKKDGKETMHGKIVVSGDGKTLTVSLTGTNAKGEAVNNTAVYEKQQ